MRKKILFLVIGLMIIITPLAWWAVNQPQKIEVSLSLIWMDVPELTKRSDTIIIGTVKQKLPTKVDRSGPGPMVYTDYIVGVEDYLKNPLDKKEIVVRTWGGKSYEEKIIMTVFPSIQLEHGQRVLLFLFLLEDGVYDVTGVTQGKYQIKDGMALNEEIPERNMELKELKDLIRRSDKQ